MMSSLITYEQREAIFAKDYLSISDVQQLLGLDYSTASQTVAAIKRATPDKLNIRGKVLIQDYINYFGLDIARYTYKGEIYGK